MIGNKYLEGFFNYEDEDTSFNQLLETLKYKDMKFIDSLTHEPVDLDICSEDELIYLTKASALIDDYLQTHEIEVPDWLRDRRLVFDRPYYHSKRISDFEKVRLQFTSTGPFRARNTYFDLDGIGRV